LSVCPVHQLSSSGKKDKTMDHKILTTDVMVSIVIPLFNEEANMHVLIERLEKVLHALNEWYEIILVDDGSRDATWKQIQILAKRNHCIKGLSFSRNFGHQQALLAGLTYSKGQAIISMDGDLQHPPELIPEMVAAWESGYKIVLTHRNDEESAGFFKRISSKYFYAIFSLMTDVSMSEGTSDFRLIDRRVLENLLRFHDIDLFLRGAISWLGFPAKTIAFHAAKRLTGDTKYHLKTMLRFASGAMVSFSTKPLILGVWIGILTSVLACIEILYIVIQYVRGATVPGWASTTSIMVFLFGILFIILGIIGIYLARIHQALQQRPQFVVADAVNIADFD
jgi:dolichol-phosphate mannosyltransferase